MTDKFYEKTLVAERKYTGKIINVDLLDIELPDGRKTCLTSVAGMRLFLL